MEYDDPLQPYEFARLDKLIDIDGGIEQHLLVMRREWQNDSEFAIKALLDWTDEAVFCPSCSAPHSSCANGMVIGLELGAMRYPKLYSQDLTFATLYIFGARLRGLDDNKLMDEVTHLGLPTLGRWPGLDRYATHLFRSFEQAEECQEAKTFYSAGVGFGLFIHEYALLRVAYESTHDIRREWALDIVENEQV